MRPQTASSVLTSRRPPQPSTAERTPSQFSNQQKVPDAQLSGGQAPTPTFLSFPQFPNLLPWSLFEKPDMSSEPTSLPQEMIGLELHLS